MPNPSPEDSPDVPDSPVVQRDSNGYAWLHSMQSSVSPATTPSSSRAASPLMFNTYEATLAEKIRARIESKDKFFSLEFFPPRTKAGAVNLMSRLDRMRSGNPLYIGKTLQTHTNGLTMIFNEINYGFNDTVVSVGIESAINFVQHDFEVSLNPYLFY